MSLKGTIPWKSQTITINGNYISSAKFHPSRYRRVSYWYTWSDILPPRDKCSHQTLRYATTFASHLKWSPQSGQWWREGKKRSRNAKRVTSIQPFCTRQKARPTGSCRMSRWHPMEHARISIKQRSSVIIFHRLTERTNSNRGFATCVPFLPQPLCISIHFASLKSDKYSKDDRRRSDNASEPQPLSRYSRMWRI